jgi:hypothetical protein
MIEREADQRRGELESPRALTPEVVAARIALRVAELRLLAAWTSVLAGRARPPQPYGTRRDALPASSLGHFPRGPRCAPAPSSLGLRSPRSSARCPRSSNISPNLSHVRTLWRNLTERHGFEATMALAPARSQQVLGRAAL